MTPLHFTVLGKPQPKGAHTSFIPRKRDGSMVKRRDGQPMVVTKDTNANQPSAEQAIAVAALQARQAEGAGIVDGPVAMQIWYFFPRNKGHYGSGRNANVLKDSAPAYPLTAADIDKTERLVYDAITGILVRDDKQVVECLHRKKYAEGDDPPRVEVWFIPLADQTVGDLMRGPQLAIAA